MEQESTKNISFQYAAFWQRAAALVVDSILLFGIILLLIGLVYLLESTAKALAGIIAIIAVFTYFFGGPLYLASSTGIFGQTLGKKLLKIKVVRKDADVNKKIGILKAFVREVIGKGIIEPIFLFIGFLWMIWNKEKQTWHDKISGTIVIKENPL